MDKKINENVFHLRGSPELPDYLGELLLRWRENTRDIVVSDRDWWASHDPGIILAKGVGVRGSRNLRCSAADDRKLRGLSANSLCPIVIDFYYGGPVCAAGVSTDTIVSLERTNRDWVSVGSP